MKVKDMRDSIRLKSEIVIEDMIDWLAQGFSLSGSVSWGKDSLAVTILMVEAIRRAKERGMAIADCTLVSANTGTENPEMDYYCELMANAMKVYCRYHDLPIKYHVASPDITASFHYRHIGRGFLFRYPGMTRDCTVDWKIKPMSKVKKRLLASNSATQLTLIGTRFSESETRNKEMQGRGEQPSEIMFGTLGEHYATPIADWDVEDVWCLIMYCDQRDGKAIYHSFKPHFDETLTLYREANGGECVAILGDKNLSQAACGARFGCWSCMPSGTKDKSLTAMVEQGNQHLKHILALRDWMFAVRWDYGARQLIGKAINPKEPIKLAPNEFRLSMRKKMLGFMLTIDVIERERAAREGVTPRFQLLTPSQIITIDYLWMLDADETKGFSALTEYHNVVYLGARHFPSSDDLTATPKEPFTVKWFYDERLALLDEPVREITPSKFFSRALFTVDDDKCKTILARDLPAFIGSATPHDAVCFYLHSGVIKTRKSHYDFVNSQLNKQAMWSRYSALVGCSDIHSYAHYHSTIEKPSPLNN